jgi:hypothetical protein
MMDLPGYGDNPTVHEDKNVNEASTPKNRDEVISILKDIIINVSKNKRAKMYWDKGIKVFVDIAHLPSNTGNKILKSTSYLDDVLANLSDHEIKKAYTAFSGFKWNDKWDLYDPSQEPLVGDRDDDEYAYR